MLRFVIRHRTLITYLAVYFFGVSAFLRYVDGYLHQPYQWTVIGLLSAFLLLSALEPLVSRRSRLYTHLYLGIQSVIIAAVALMPHRDDWFSNLYIALTLQAAHVFPSRTAFRWIGGFALMFIPLLFYTRGLSEGVPLVLITTVAVFLIGSWLALINNAEASNQETQALLSELQDAHRQLQLYTAQAEELAVLEDRNRLARNLHDSVSQTIFSMRLTAEAARLLLERDQAQAGAQLAKLQELSESALVAMRALIHELRPTAIAEQGLIPALRRLLTLLERQHGLTTTFNVTGEPDLSDEQAEQIYRVVQEGLNNVVKHARTDRASVTACFEKARLLLQIEDRGKGFSPDRIEATRQINELHPETKVIVLSSFTEDDKVFPAIRSGAAGYLLKDIAPAELASAIRAVTRGKTQLHPDIARKLMNQFVDPKVKNEGIFSEDLTPREVEVLRLLARGMSNAELAKALFISEKTVKTHISNILGKLNLADRTQAAIYAYKHGLVENK